MPQALIVGVQPDSGKTLAITLENGDSIIVVGTKKQLRKAVPGGDIYNNVRVTYRASMLMSSETWGLVQPLLQREDFSPELNMLINSSFDQLQELPQFAWVASGRRPTIVFTYFPIDFWRVRESGELYGTLWQLNFPEQGVTTMWRITLSKDLGSISKIERQEEASIFLG